MKKKQETACVAYLVSSPPRYAHRFGLQPPPAALCETKTNQNAEGVSKEGNQIERV
jgi:hypothetical protein